MARWQRIPSACMSGVLGLAVATAAMAQPSPVECTAGAVPTQAILAGGAGDPVQPDLIISGNCTMGPGDYYYRNVNIIAVRNADGSFLRRGTLSFVEGPSAGSRINFWAANIIIENDGAMLAGETTPFGANGGTLTITLYGRDQSNGNPVTTPGLGALCVTPVGSPVKTPSGTLDTTAQCGIPASYWNNHQDTTLPLPGGISDFFYAYEPLYGDGKQAANGYVGYFGYKSLGLSFGGTLRLRGQKGTTGAAAADADPSRLNTGTSWVRLAQGANVPAAAAEMTLERSVQNDWQADDRVVITSTDFIPGHSEVLTIGSVNGAQVTFKPDPNTNPAGQTLYPHNGTRYPLAAKLGLMAKLGTPPTFSGPATRLNLNPAQLAAGLETRAAAALLTRSIRIVSGGNFAGQSLRCATTGTDAAPCPATADPPDARYSLGGHTVYRQGFAELKLQGVEFAELGQGGRLGHYPVHFHMARQVPANTWVKDSVVHESMTRWFVIHSTLGVTLQRNIGYRSIGHGFYLEDGTETNNRLYTNLGIYARAAVHGPDNPRSIPGILAQNDVQGDLMPYISDVNHPTVFWIMNGWNDFVGNMAVGAGTCGSCYWLLPGLNAGADWVPGSCAPSDGSLPGGHHAQKWSGYSALQTAVRVVDVPSGVCPSLKQYVSSGMAGTTPLRVFSGNSCSGAMNGFMTVGDTAVCHGVVAAPPLNTPPPAGVIAAVRSIAPARIGNFQRETYYPRVDPGTRFPTLCDETSTDPAAPRNCANVARLGTKCDFANPANCAVTLLDRYTQSFSWADFSFSAMWLRSGWYLLQDSAVTDVQNSGITLVSGGDYSRSSVPVGYWAMVRNTVFVGETQPGGKYTGAGGPFVPPSDVTCQAIPEGTACVNTVLSMTMPLVSYGVNQRLFNIYDGPTYQDSNAYLDIRQTPCTGTADCMYWNTLGVRLNPATNKGYLPNAAIGWKQPNGFYYPPAFHSLNMWFGNVDIRHYVIEPVMRARTYLTDPVEAAKRFTGKLAPDMFTGYTDIDRQTVLNDDDGSLTGLVSTQTGSPDTISVNLDDFFNAPVETAQCLSNLGVTPDKACAGSGTTTTRATAKTSPYDYVTTVIYPDCALKNNGVSEGACGSYVGPPVPAQGPAFTQLPGQGGEWSKNCGGPYCFGVPIYRQYLTGSNTAGSETYEWKRWRTLGCDTPPTSSKPFDPANPAASQCLFPFARMAGTSTWQRNVLTVNGGRYYIDTTVSEQDQRLSQHAGLASDINAVYIDCGVPGRVGASCQPLSVNVFKPNRKYYVMFVYAKPNIRQEYQMYVGPGASAANVKLARINVDGEHFELRSTGPVPNTWTVRLVPGTTDTLSIAVNMASFNAELNPAGVQNISPSDANLRRTCLPSSFCQPVAGESGQASCGCALPDNDPRIVLNPRLKDACQQVCKYWSVKDLDCPRNGCIAFEVTTTSGFQANSQFKRPTPAPFPSAASNPLWAIGFQRTATQLDASTRGDCYYPKLPGTAACPVPDTVNAPAFQPAASTSAATAGGGTSGMGEGGTGQGGAVQGGASPGGTGPRRR